MSRIKNCHRSSAMLVAFTVALAGCRQPENKPDAGNPKADTNEAQKLPPTPPAEPNPPAETKKVEPVKDFTKVEPVFKMTFAEFQNECNENSEKARSKFLGKMVELSGQVSDVGRNSDGKPTVHLQRVACETTDAYPWAKVAKGQTIKIKGTVDFIIGGYSTLTNCVFVETGKYMAASVTATDLAKECAADFEAASKKYDAKSVVISGEVMSKDVHSTEAATVVLKSDNNVKVKCQFDAAEKDFTKRVEVGKQIKVFAEYLFPDARREDNVELYRCKPLPIK